MAKNEKGLKVDERYPEGKFDADSSSEALTAEEISKKYTVPELKYILRENGLSVSGKKKDLVERVLPLLNDDSSESSGEDESNDLELTEKAKPDESEKVVLEQTEDSNSADEADLSFPVNEELLSSSLGDFGINYEDLGIKDKISVEENIELNIQGFIQDGLSMSDATISVVPASDSSNVNLKMNIPEVSYTNFENTIFTFNNLDLFILPSSNPQSLEFSALMDSLEIITERNYVNLRDLNLFLKSFPDENGIRLDIGIKNFIYPNFNDTSFTFENLDFSMAIGSEGENLAISVNLPSLNLLNKNYRVKLSDLNLNVALPDLKLSNLDLSILMSDFHYTNFDDVHVDLDAVDVSIEPILNSNTFRVLIGMNGFDLTGINSFDELFPMLNINNISFKSSHSDLEPPVNMIGSISPLDVSKMSFSNLAALLSSGFDMDTYINNMSGQYKGSLDGYAGISSAYPSGSAFDLGSIFENFDYSSLDAIELNLTDLIDSAGINLAELGIDVSDYDLSAIAMSDLIDIVITSDLMAAIMPMFKLLSLDLDNLDMSGLINSFDFKNLDIAALLGGLDLSVEDISGILEMLDSSDVDLAGIFENFDYSILDVIELNLAGLIDSLGIDLAVLGIDVSDYDLSSIRIPEIMAILNNSEFDMSDISSMLKLTGLDLDNLDLTDLINSLDLENLDIAALLGSLNLSSKDISSILNMLDNPELDLEGMFENFDYSILDAIELNLAGLIDSLGIDLADMGIDLSDYDLSTIKISELMDILNNPDFDMSSITAMLKLTGLELDDLDLSGLINSFDFENLDIAALLGSLDLSVEDISGILEMLNNSDLDLEGIFENFDYSCLDAIELNLAGLIDSLGIDLADMGIDLSDYDLSTIKISELMGILNNFDFDMSSVGAMLKLTGLELDDLDLSGLINSFDVDAFDMSGLLAGLDLSGEDILGILEMLDNSELDLEGIFENFDYSSLDAIELNLDGLIDSAGIDLVELGIDVSDYDLSSIRISEIMGILDNSDYDMTDFAAMFMGENKPITIEKGVTDTTKKYYHVDCNVADVDFNETTGKWEYQGLELKYYNKDKHEGKLSKKEVKEHNEKCQGSGLELDDLDLSGLINSFDVDKFDMSGLLAGLDLSGEDISAILDIFNNSELDLEGIFENFDYSCLDAIELNLAGLVDSAGIDLTDLGIDVSDYDLSTIRISEIMGILDDSDFDMSSVGLMFKLSGLELDDLDLSGLINNFDVDAFDMAGLLAGLDLSGEDISGIFDMLDNSELDFEAMFENFDYSSLDAIELNLAGLIDSVGIDLADMGIDLSDYDLSAIKISNIMDILDNSDFDMSNISEMFKLSGLELDDLDLSGLINSFDADEMDWSALLGSLDLSGENISGILGMLGNSGLDFEVMFKNFDYSILDVIELNLAGLIDSVGIDLAVLGIDVSDYDLSTIRISEIMGILDNSDFDMASIFAMFKLSGLELDDLDLAGLINSFDFEDIDWSALLGGLNLSIEEFSTIADLFNNLNLDFEAIFENFDYSCLDAIVLNLAGLIDSTGIDLAGLGFDVSDYDLSAISMSDLMGIINNSDLNMAIIPSMLKLFNMDLNNLDMSGLINSFDSDELDISALLTSLNIEGLDISGILDMLDRNGFDVTVFLNLLLSSFMEKSVQ